ncbi:hypothetical protein A2U01_0029883, partial [Trifolium medium]|nr:hypothetical protein [Trifolium medium]
VDTTAIVVRSGFFEVAAPRRTGESRMGKTAGAGAIAGSAAGEMWVKVAEFHIFGKTDGYFSPFLNSASIANCKENK